MNLSVSVQKLRQQYISILVSLTSFKNSHLFFSVYICSEITLHYIRDGPVSNQATKVWPDILVSADIHLKLYCISHTGLNS